MDPYCRPAEHVSRRVLLKGALATAGGAMVGNFGGLFHHPAIAAQVTKTAKRCILLWMNGGASQIDTFDMKPGTETGGPFRPIQTKTPGLQICEYLPRIARQTDKLAIIRSMKTTQPDHPDGIRSMHVGHKLEASINHPELGAVIAKFHGDPDSDLPTFVRTGSTGNGGAGFLGPKFQPFSVGKDGRLPPFTESYLKAENETRRNDLLRFMEGEFQSYRKADPFEAHRLAKENSWRLLKAKAVFDNSKDWPKYKDLYGDSEFGKGCLMARKLVEAGVPFVEIGQENYDSHADNFTVHKASLSLLDPAWSGLMIDLQERGLWDDTLIVWMGEVGRTPTVNNRIGRDHYINGWTIVLAGGCVRGGTVYGATNANGVGVKDDPVGEGDLFATIYTALGIDPATKHYVGPRPIPVAPDHTRVLRELLV